MSQESLAIYNTHRKYQVEQGTFSETGLIDGSIEVSGVFDDHYDFGNKDAGNVMQNSHRVKFLVDTVPAFTPKVSKLVLDRGTYIIMKSDKDDQGVPRLWLK